MQYDVKLEFRFNDTVNANKDRSERFLDYTCLSKVDFFNNFKEDLLKEYSYGHITSVADRQKKAFEAWSEGRSVRINGNQYTIAVVIDNPMTDKDAARESSAYDRSQDGHKLVKRYNIAGVPFTVATGYSHKEFMSIPDNKQGIESGDTWDVPKEEMFDGSLEPDDNLVYYDLSDDKYKDYYFEGVKPNIDPTGLNPIFDVSEACRYVQEELTDQERRDMYLYANGPVNDGPIEMNTFWDWWDGLDENEKINYANIYTVIISEAGKQRRAVDFYASKGLYSIVIVREMKNGKNVTKCITRSHCMAISYSARILSKLLKTHNDSINIFDVDGSLEYTMTLDDKGKVTLGTITNSAPANMPDWD